jgi:hypothetical protein
VSGTIWLIVEDDYDGKVVQSILSARNIHVRVQILNPSGNTGGISRLVTQIEKLVATARSQKENNDCIAVLHDADEFTQPDRSVYNQIAKICKKYQVVEIIAYDELESWLLADGGVCRWLGINQQPWDNLARPSDKLNSLLKEKKGIKYQGKYRDDVRNHLDGTGDQQSRSMRKAFKHLDDAPCIEK